MTASQVKYRSKLVWRPGNCISESWSSYYGKLLVDDSRYFLWIAPIIQTHSNDQSNGFTRYVCADVKTICKEFGLKITSL